MTNKLIAAAVVAGGIFLSNPQANAASDEAPAMNMMFLPQLPMICVKYTSNPDRRVYASKWADGVMSGMNMARLLSGLDSRNLAGAASGEAIMEYCKAHPYKDFLFAVADLYNSLPVVQGTAASFERVYGAVYGIKPGPPR
jgi:hypothetical protein